jgi:hypothetical protein
MQSLVSDIKLNRFNEISRQVSEKTKFKNILEKDVEQLSKDFNYINSEKEINFKELVLAKGEAQSLRVLDHVS